MADATLLVELRSSVERAESALYELVQILDAAGLEDQGHNDDGTGISTDKREPCLALLETHPEPEIFSACLREAEMQQPDCVIVCANRDMKPKLALLQVLQAARDLQRTVKKVVLLHDWFKGSGKHVELIKLECEEPLVKWLRSGVCVTNWPPSCCVPEEPAKLDQAETSRVVTLVRKLLAKEFDTM